MQCVAIGSNQAQNLSIFLHQLARGEGGDDDNGRDLDLRPSFSAEVDGELVFNEAILKGHFLAPKPMLYQEPCGESVKILCVATGRTHVVRRAPRRSACKPASILDLIRLLSVTNSLWSVERMAERTRYGLPADRPLAKLDLRLLKMTRWFLY